MNNKNCKIAICVAIALNFGAAAPVWSQSTPASSESRGGGLELEEIVVTARRVEERAQDVPISMTIFNQQQLTDRQISSASDLGNYTPSLQANTQFGADATSFSVRGFRQEVYTTASVAVYFADVVAARAGGSVQGGDGAGPGSFFDLQNVQVLKGPQGTLFGRNTDGGAILLVPQRPTTQLEGYVDVAYGNYDMIQTTGVLNLPVNDNFRMRFGVDHKSRDGYMINTTGIGPKDFNDVGYTAGRASAIWDITPNLENYTVASFSKSDHHGDGSRMIDCNAAFPGIGPLFTCPQLASQAGSDYFDFQNDNPDAHSYLQLWQVINTTSWLATDNLTVKNIASYAVLKQKSDTDVFGTNLVVPSFIPGIGGTPVYFTEVKPARGLSTNAESTATEEVQFQGRTSDSRLVWTGGIYSEFNNPIGQSGSSSPSFINCTNPAALQCFDVVAAVFRQPEVGSLNYRPGEVKFRSYGIYEQASYNLTDTLKLTEGFRYTIDKSSADIVSAWYHFPAPNTPVLSCFSTLSNGNIFTPVASTDACRLSFNQKSTAPTWVIGLDWKPIDDILLYGKYSRGYRQGAVAPYAADGFNTYKPEKVDTYEIGTKTEYSHALHGTFNVAAFYNDFTNQQIQVGFACVNTSVCGGGAQNIGIVNAGKSRIWGIEVESGIAPFKGFTLEASYSYLNSTLVSLTLPSLVPGSAYDTVSATAGVGQVIPLTPTHKGTATATYTLPLPSGIGRVSAGITYAYNGKMLQSFTALTPFTPAYSLVNLNLNWRSILNSHVDAGLFVTNLTNEKYMTFIGGLYNTAGFDSASLGEPRMYGARVRWNFGQ